MTLKKTTNTVLSKLAASIDAERESMEILNDKILNDIVRAHLVISVADDPALAELPPEERAKALRVAKALAHEQRVKAIADRLQSMLPSGSTVAAAAVNGDVMDVEVTVKTRGTLDLVTVEMDLNE